MHHRALVVVFAALLGCGGSHAGQPLEICLKEGDGIPLGHACEAEAIYSNEMCLPGGVCFHGYCAAACEVTSDCEASTCNRDSPDAQGACSAPCDTNGSSSDPPPFLDQDHAQCIDGFWGYDMPRVCFNGGDPGITD